jgi:hypothetical protein
MNKNFDTIINDNQSPTTDFLRVALAFRQYLSEEEANFITYQCGFTHYPEAVTVFEEFGLKMRNDISVLQDTVNNRFHCKILINELTHEIESLSMPFLSEKFDTPVLINAIKLKDQSKYIDDSWQFIHDFYEQLKQLPQEERERFAKDFFSQVENPMSEDVVSFSKNLMNGQTMVFHFARVRARNTVQNIQQLFQNVTAVIAANFIFGGNFNLGVEELRKIIECHTSLRKALWYVIPTDFLEELLVFLETLGCEYRMLPPEMEKDGYVDSVMREIESKLIQVFAKG